MTAKELTLRDKKELAKTQGREKTYQTRMFVPDVDIYEKSDAIILKADMPGVDKQNVDVNLKEGVLTIEGRVNPTEYENLQAIYSEYNVGHFSRQFNIGDEIDQSKIQAAMDNGVLTLTLPKTEKMAPRQIEIK